MELDQIMTEIRTHGIRPIMPTLVKDPELADKVAQRCAEFAKDDSSLDVRESWCSFATDIAMAAAAKRIMDNYLERGYEHEANHVAEISGIKKYL